jgi:hypothetical protein
VARFGLSGIMLKPEANRSWRGVEGWCGLPPGMRTHPPPRFPPKSIATIAPIACGISCATCHNRSVSHASDWLAKCLGRRDLVRTKSRTSSALYEGRKRLITLLANCIRSILLWRFLANYDRRSYPGILIKSDCHVLWQTDATM